MITLLTLTSVIPNHRATFPTKKINVSITVPTRLYGYFYTGSLKTKEVIQMDEEHGNSAVRAAAS